MYDKNIIIESFTGLVGLRQNDNPEFPQIPQSLLYNGSNVLIQHTLINIENIDMCARNYSKFEYPAWLIATAYKQGNRVKYNLIVYEALQDNTGSQPDTSPADWEEVNLLGLYLTDVFNNAIEDTVETMFRRKKLEGQTKTLLSSLRPFDVGGSYQDLIINEGDLVGLAIKLRHTNNLITIVNRIGLQLSQANPTFKFFVYHSSQRECIATVTVNHTKIFSFQWHDTATAMRFHYLSDDLDIGGTFFIMYDQNLLVGQAIKKSYNFGVAPCSYCDASLITRFDSYSRYLSMQTVRVRAVNRVANPLPNEPDLLWDITRNMERVPDNNFGMNFEFTVRCDLTSFLKQQKDLFAYALRDVTILKLLEGMANSTRQNINQEKLNQLARLELQSTAVGGMGMIKKVDQMIEEVNFEISNLDSTCMPCNTSNGFRLGTFGLNR